MSNNTNGKIRNDNSSPAGGFGNIAAVSIILSMLFLIPFVLIPFVYIGINTLIQGIAAVSQGGEKGMPILIFAIMWNLILCFIIFSSIRSFLRIKNRKKSDVPLTADYPEAEYPKAEYPKADYPDANYPEPEPEQKTMAQPFFSSFPSVGESNVDYDDEDYKDMKRKGYE